MVKMSQKISEQISQAMQLDTPKTRLESFLKIEAPGIQGVAELRDRQERVFQGLARIRRGGIAMFPSQKPRPLFSQVTCSDRQTKGRGLVSALRILGEAYHDNIKSLYRSKYARVHFGSSGSFEDWDHYGSSRKYALRYQYPGIRVNWETEQIVIEDYKDDTIRLPIPRPLLDAPKSITGKGLLPGDIFGVKNKRKLDRGTIVRRYALINGTYKKSGYAWILDNTVEHGDSVAEIRAELLHKKETELRREQARKITIKEGRRIARVARLISRMCNFKITYADARNAGLCRAGIDSFKKHAGITVDVMRKDDLLKFRELRPTDIDRLVTRTAEGIATAMLSKRKELAIQG